MSRRLRDMAVTVVVVGGLGLLLARAGVPPVPEREGRPMGEQFVKSDADWREQLTPEQYNVTRRHGTERAFTGEYWDTKSDGVYACVCCGQPLFDAQTKFDSGTGWPSFWAPADVEAVSTKTDRDLLMTRTEVLCSGCDASMGSVFDVGQSRDEH